MPLLQHGHHGARLTLTLPLTLTLTQTLTLTLALTLQEMLGLLKKHPLLWKTTDAG